MKSKTAWKVGGLVALGLLLAGAAGLALTQELSAQSEGTVGYVDVVRIMDEYLAPVLDEPLSREVDRLQAEFDAASEGLADEEKRELFNQYQALLDSIKQEMIDQQLPAIHQAVAEVAGQEGITVVLTKDAVLYGGVDLTDAVLERLAAAGE
ncbi:MAG: OmpH family outer membrane protein [Firmicutes bacterium]|nr:OmpH family outer membrane protein [Bacillota bacterium]